MTTGVAHEPEESTMPQLRTLRLRSEALREKSIRLQLGPPFFEDDDDLWDFATKGPPPQCPFLKQRSVLILHIDDVLVQRRRRRRAVLLCSVLALASTGCGASLRDDLPGGDTTGIEDDTDTTGTSTIDVQSVTGGGWGSTTRDPRPDGPLDEELPPEEPPPPVDTPPDVHTIRISGDDDPHLTAPGYHWLSVYAKDDHVIDRVEFRTSEDDDPVGVATVSDGAHGFGVPWELNHHKYQGLTTFTATAFDDTGQSASASIVLTANLLPTGHMTPLTGTYAPTISEVWSDIAVKPDGELVIVGYRTITLVQIDDDDLVFDRLVLERRSPDGDEIIAADFIDTPADTDVRGLAVALRDDEVYVLSDREGISHIARYGEDGEQLDSWASSGVEFRDLVVADGAIVTTGNTGTLNQTQTSARTWWFTPTLSLNYKKTINGDGADFNAGQAVAVVGEDVVVAGFVEQQNGERASLLARYNAFTAEEKWVRVLIGDDYGERLADVAAVGSKLVAIGTSKIEGSTRIMLRRFNSDGTPEHTETVLHPDEGEGRRLVAMPGDVEFVIAARTCTSEPKCTTRIRRYEWAGPHLDLLWSDWVGKSISETPTALAAAPLGFALATRHGSVSLGEGHHEQSGLREYHP